MQNLLKNTTKLAQAICSAYIAEFQAEKGRVMFAYEDGFCTRSETERAENPFANDVIVSDVVAIDATCGNGHDTLWLVELCDRVYAFDIQLAAIEATEKLLSDRKMSCRISKLQDTDEVKAAAFAADTDEKSENHCGRKCKVEMICDTHENMKNYVKDKAAVIVFNLGYLPNGDKSVATTAESTLNALNASLELLRVNGLLCVTMYQGHEAGEKEREAVLKWAKTLDKSVYHCVHTDMINQPNCPPEILLVTKKKAKALIKKSKLPTENF